MVPNKYHPGMCEFIYMAVHRFRHLQWEDRRLTGLQVREEIANADDGRTYRLLLEYYTPNFNRQVLQLGIKISQPKVYRIRTPDGVYYFRYLFEANEYFGRCVVHRDSPAVPTRMDYYMFENRENLRTRPLPPGDAIYREHDLR